MFSSVSYKPSYGTHVQIMEESDIISQLRAENAHLKNQIEKLTNQLSDVQGQNTVLLQQNGEVLLKLDNIAKVQNNMSTANLMSSNHNLNVGKSNKRLSNDDTGFVFGASKLQKITAGRNNLSGENRNPDEIMKDVNENDDQNQNHESWASMVENDSKLLVHEKATPIQIKLYERDENDKIRIGLDNNFGGKFTWKQLNPGYPARIYSKDEATKVEISEFLRDAGVEFSSFSSKKDRKRGYIIRGLADGNDTSTIEKINDALINHGVVGNFIVKRYVTGNMKRNPEKSAVLFAVITEADAIDGNLCEIKQIGSFRVNVQKMKKSSVIQCRNCQRFNHTANQCSYAYRCVQCTGNHGPGVCPRKLNANLPVGCINCKAAKFNQFSGHTANNLRECQFYINQVVKTSDSVQSQGPNKNGKLNTNNSSPNVPVLKSIQSNKFNVLNDEIMARSSNGFSHKQKLRYKKKMGANGSGESI